jgi:hypothetical protein
MEAKVLDDLTTKQNRREELAQQATNATTNATQARRALIEGGGDAEAVAVAEATATALSQAVATLDSEIATARATLAAAEVEAAREAKVLRAVEAARAGNAAAAEFQQVLCELDAKLADGAERAMAALARVQEAQAEHSRAAAAVAGIDASEWQSAAAPDDLHRKFSTMTALRRSGADIEPATRALGFLGSPQNSGLVFCLPLRDALLQFQQLKK